MDLHERKTTQLTGYLWPRCDGCAGRSSSGSLAKLGSLRPLYSDFRDYPEMVTFIHSIVGVVRMKRRRFQQVESTMFLLYRAELTSTQQWAMMGPTGGALCYLLQRDYPEMVTFIHSIAEVVRMKRRRFHLLW